MAYEKKKQIRLVVLFLAHRLTSAAVRLSLSGCKHSWSVARNCCSSNDVMMN